MYLPITSDGNDKLWQKNLIHLLKKMQLHLPRPLWILFEPFLLLLALFVWCALNIRVSTADEMRELEELKKENKELYKIRYLELEIEKLKTERNHWKMLTDNFWQDYTGCAKMYDKLEAKYKMSIQQSTKDTDTINILSNIVSKQALTIQKLEVENVALKSTDWFSSNISLQKQIDAAHVFIFILSNQMQSLKNKQQTSNASIAASVESLAKWKQGFVQAIFYCALTIGASRRKVTKKELSQLYIDFFKYDHNHEPDFEAPKEFFWIIYREWLKSNERRSINLK